MTARFEVHKAVNLRDRYLFGLVGVIEEGMVHTGMNAHLVEEDEDDEVAGDFEGRFHGVEFTEINGTTPEPTLTFHYRDPEKIQRWESIDWEGRTVRLEWSIH
jgi:hypothetical protein